MRQYRMQLNKSRISAGFTLIELVLVIVILGTLAAVAIPKFMNLSGQAYSADVRQTAASFQTGVILAHSAWTVAGKSGTVVNLPGFLDGSVDFSATGWPVDTAGRTDLSVDEQHQACMNVRNIILQNPPSIVSRLVTTPSDWCVDGDKNACIFFYKRNGNTNCNGADGMGNWYDARLGFNYNVVTGAVVVKAP